MTDKNAPGTGKGPQGQPTPQGTPPGYRPEPKTREAEAAKDKVREQGGERK